MRELFDGACPWVLLNLAESCDGPSASCDEVKRRHVWSKRIVWKLETKKKTLNGFYAWVLLDLGEVCFE
jgi:hypothetical protein